MAAPRGIRQTMVEPAQEFEQETQRAGHAPLLSPTAPEPDPAQPCRPLRRRPVPILWIMDDGQRTGEVVRIRKTPLSIGRTVGDVRIPHDELIADPQAEIAWVKQSLLVRNLTSQAGLFQRVAKAPLSAGMVVRIGAARYQFGEPGEWMPLDEREGSRWLSLPGNKVWIGRAAGQVGIACKDPTVDGRHACLIRETSGKWFIVDNKSLNGTWVSVSEMQVDGVAEFMLGEQVFRLEVSLRQG